MNGRSAARKLLTPAESEPERPVLITGGAGFIGANLAHRVAASGHKVIVYDNLSRPGVERNLAWLKSTHSEHIIPMVADIRDLAALREAVRAASRIFHLAAQVAVTTSLVDPAEDFAVNARGTLDLLEAIRGCAAPPPLLFTSTNKVYGAIHDLPLAANAKRYAVTVGARGIDETRPLDFHSPYGCSKGTADQYVLDYARSYGLPAVVFRMSCIYGPHQCGTEDQGWVAHFLLRALAGEAITLYGDGRQVRDILYIDDLVDALLLAQQRIAALSGHPFNIGGGAGNTTSLLELIERITLLHGRAPKVVHGAWRTGDQHYYVSDHGKFTVATGWRPQVDAPEGVARLYRWLREHRAESLPAAVALARPGLGVAKAAARASVTS